MSNATPAPKEKEEKFVLIREDGVASAKRFHYYKDCSTFGGRQNNEFESVDDREVWLMGLKACSQCERRKTGGPAIEALEGFFTDVMHGELVPRDAAWAAMEYLKERNFYVAQRKTS